MEKERVIAEMAEQACPNLCDCGYCTLDNQPCNKTTCGVGEILETLYDKGYRKVDGTNYVSMEWHDEQIQHADYEIEELKMKLQHAEENAEMIMAANNQLQVEAVRDFAEELKMRFDRKYKDRGATDARVLMAQSNFLTCIDELLNEWVEK